MSRHFINALLQIAGFCRFLMWRRCGTNSEGISSETTRKLVQPRGDDGVLN